MASSTRGALPEPANGKLEMNKKILIGIAGAAVVAIGASALMFGGGSSAAAGKYTYETVAVDKGDVSRVISASGAVQPREKVEVGSEVSGKITAIYVDFNDAVKKDQVLAQVDPETFQTSQPDVFAGGDVVLGPRLFIDAIATGQQAARSIHDYLRGTTTTTTLQSHWEPATYAMGETWETRMRRLPPSRAPHADEIARAGNELVEENYSAAEARSQAERCLRCDVQTYFEGEKCIACNGCVDVCPDDCLHLVGLSQVATNPELATLAERQLGISQKELSAYTPIELNRMGGVMLKDETACIRCSMCASRCPTHAFTMRRFVFHRELATETKANPRLHREVLVP